VEGESDVKINCPACGHSIELSEAYDDYEGQIRCWVCRAVFEMRTQEGCVKTVKERKPAPSRPSSQAFSGVTNNEVSCKR
jgi:hypothetical protein